MTKYRPGIVALLLLAVASPAVAQKAASFRASPALFSHLFETDMSGALRGSVLQSWPSGIRHRRVNQTCSGCEERPGSVHLIADSSLLTDDWIVNHQYHPENPRFGDNAAIADFWYDGVHRRILSRSAAFHEVDDPADVRLGRAPGHYPNEPAFDALLPEGTTVGQVGFDTWKPDGFGSYFAAMQGTVGTDGTGYLVLATATGRAGVTRTGSQFEPEDLVRHVRLHPSGQLEVGFETPKDAQPDPLLLVRGAAGVEGSMKVGGAMQVQGPMSIGSEGGNVPHACSLRDAKSRSRTVSVACGPSEIAVSGGGTCEEGNMKGSRPLQSSTKPDGWEVSCSDNGWQTAFVICCSQ
jgi:hypothetical protein